MARGILGLLLLANRKLLISMLCYWAVATVLAHSLLAGSFLHSMPSALDFPKGASRSEMESAYQRYHAHWLDWQGHELYSTLGLYLLLPLAPLFILIIARLSLNYDSKSGYPAYMLRLPASSAALAIWPMAVGIPIVCGYWALFSTTVFAPMGADSSTLFVCSALCVAVTCSLAIYWAPFGGAGSGVAFVGVIGLFAAIGPLALARQLYFMPAWGIVSAIYRIPLSAFLALSVLGAVCAVFNVSISRRGDVFSASDDQSLAARLKLPRRALREGSDGRRALAWFYWNGEDAALANTPFILAAISLPFLLFGDRVDLTVFSPLLAGLASFKVSLFAIMTALVIPYLSLLFAVGGNSRPASTLGNILTKPLTDLEIARIKFGQTARGVGLTLARLAPVVCLALLSPATKAGIHAPLGWFIRPALNAQVMRCIVLVVLLYAVFLWRARTGGVWSSILGRPWLNAIPFFAILLVVGSMSFTEMAGGDTILGKIGGQYQTILVILSSLKVAAILAVAATLRQRGILDWTGILGGLLVWLSCVAVIAVVGVAVLHSIAPAVIIAASLVIVPIVRIGLIPLAVERARHR